VPDCEGVLLSFRGQVADEAAARRLAVEQWPLGEIADAYRRFIERFAPMREAVRLTPPSDRLTALVARILLIHEYRRIVLRDPQLPPPLLPEGWPGDEARRLCAGLYRALLALSELWLDEHGRAEGGALPSPGPRFRERFRDAG
jgi:phenylacetic acid degradation operon negative regulatory protein